MTGSARDTAPAATHASPATTGPLPPGRTARLASAATWMARTTTSATTPPDPMAGSLRAISACAASRASSASVVSARPSRWTAPLATAIAPTARTAARVGTGSPRTTITRPPSAPTTAPTRPYAAAPVASRDELRTGIRVSIPNAAAISPPGRAAALTRRGPAGGRAPGRRRTRPGWTSGPSAVDGVPSATMRPPSMTTTRGKKWAARARSWRTATTVVPSRSLRSTSSSMTSTWCRMSRWAVGSSRIRIGAVCATATATKTSCRSPSDSARASRPRR